MNRNMRYPTKLNDEESNPCLKEQKMTYQCLNDNDFNYPSCAAYFKNYNKCTQFWVKVVAHRTANFISPAMPPLEDREKVKAEYKEKWQK